MTTYEKLLAIALCAATFAAPGASGAALAHETVEGCAGQYLFNGVWRVRVVAVDTGTPGSVGVTLELRNGSSKDYTMVQGTGFGGGNGAQINLVFNNDDMETMDKASQYVPYNNAIAFKHAPAGGFISGRLTFGAQANAKPVKLLIGYDPALNTDHAHYTVKDPSFRVHLNCAK